MNLSKKLARWELKLPNEEMKKELVRMCQTFLVMVHRCSLPMLVTAF
jgi:hypothetical protein